VTTPWVPGEVITRREVLHGHLWLEHPVTVVDDDGYDTDDHGLDLIVHPDGRREWKDVEHLHVQRAQGRIDLDTVGEVLAAADAAVDLLDADERWWSAYDDWVPA
jgi:hypothetical protein